MWWFEQYSWDIPGVFIYHLVLPFACSVKGTKGSAAAAHHLSMDHSFQVLPSSALFHFLLSIHLGRGCSGWIVQQGRPVLADYICPESYGAGGGSGAARLYRW